MIKTQNLRAVTQEGEQWIQIPDFPNYLVSNAGRVYSGNDNTILKGEWSEKGYHYVRLYSDKCRNGKKIKVSHLVAMVFCKGYATNKHIHHINRNRGDDRAVNLIPLTPEEHRAIHVVYDILFKNKDILTELISPVIRCNITLSDNMKGGDAA